MRESPLMRFRLPALLLWTLAAPPAAAEQRVFAIGSFDRIRVEGPYDVHVATGQSPAAAVEGEAEAVARIDLRVEGTTLIVRVGTGGWGERPQGGSRRAPVVRAATGMIRSAVVVGGGRLSVDGTLRSQRIDLSLTGSGVLAVPALDADEVNLTLLGSGGVTLGGRTGRARLITSGSGTTDATALEAGSLIVRLDGPGTTSAGARYTADVTTTGVGGVTIAGHPACTIHAAGGGPVACGDEVTADR